MNSPFWITSDQHFYHTNIIKYCSRPFQDVDEMNEIMFNNWQELIQPDDKVFFLGDWVCGCEKKYTIGQTIHDQLNGKKIFIKGNHDTQIEKYTNIKVIEGRIKVEYNGINIMMSHRPIWEHDPEIDIYIHGHIHNDSRVQLLENMKNVSVDVTDFKPVHIDQIIREFENGCLLV